MTHYDIMSKKRSGKSLKTIPEEPVADSSVKAVEEVKTTLEGETKPIIERFRKFMTDDKSVRATIIRETIYNQFGLHTAIECNFQLDSNIFVSATPESESQALRVKNLAKFLTNSSFETSDIDNGEIFGQSTGATEYSAKQIQKWLEYHGKIPKFVSIGLVENKGYGVFANCDIAKDSYLATYEGTYRPVVLNPLNRYSFVLRDSTGENVGTMDAENLTFSNWTRFVNDGHPDRRNCIFACVNHQILLFSTKDISEGDELVASYGDEYWTRFGPMLD